MKTRKIFLGLLTLFLLIGFALTSNAQPGQRFNKGGQGFNQGNQNAGNCAFMQLSPEQQGKMATLRLSFTEKNLPLRNQLGEMRAKMQSLQTGDNQDLKAISKLIDEMSAVQAKIKKNAAEHRLAVRSLLTAEQKIMFDARQGKANMGKQGKRGGAMCGNRGPRQLGNCPMK